MAGKREASARVTEELLLAAGGKLFAERGYEAVDLRTVAASVGRSTGSIFAHWKDKEEFFEAAMDRKAPGAVLRDFLTDVADGRPRHMSQALARGLLLDLCGLCSSD